MNSKKSVLLTDKQLSMLQKYFERRELAAHRRLLAAEKTAQEFSDLTAILHDARSL